MSCFPPPRRPPPLPLQCYSSRTPAQGRHRGSMRTSRGRRCTASARCSEAAGRSNTASERRSIAGQAPFRDPALYQNGVSCQSCHTEGGANADLGTWCTRPRPATSSASRSAGLVGRRRNNAVPLDRLRAVSRRSPPPDPQLLQGRQPQARVAALAVSSLARPAGVRSTWGRCRPLHCAATSSGRRLSRARDTATQTGATRSSHRRPARTIPAPRTFPRVQHRSCATSPTARMHSSASTLHQVSEFYDKTASTAPLPHRQDMDDLVAYLNALQKPSRGKTFLKGLRSRLEHPLELDLEEQPDDQTRARRRRTVCVRRPSCARARRRPVPGRRLEQPGSGPVDASAFRSGTRTHRPAVNCLLLGPQLLPRSPPQRERRRGVPRTRTPAHRPSRASFNVVWPSGRKPERPDRSEHPRRRQGLHRTRPTRQRAVRRHHAHERCRRRCGHDRHRLRATPVRSMPPRRPGVRWVPAVGSGRERTASRPYRRQRPAHKVVGSPIARNFVTITGGGLSLFTDQFIVEGELAAGATPPGMLPPATPLAPELLAADDTGVSHADHITNVAAPRIDGTTRAGAIVTATVDGAVNGTGTALADGTYSIKLPTALADGVHAITVKAANPQRGRLARRLPDDHHGRPAPAARRAELEPALVCVAPSDLRGLRRPTRSCRSSDGSRRGPPPAACSVEQGLGLDHQITPATCRRTPALRRRRWLWSAL